MLLPQCQEGIEAGTDEAGRGCLAGPVTAAAVILPQGYNLLQLNDSKKIGVQLRQKLRERIESDALSYAVVHVPPEEIDSINILNASILAMHRALEKLNTAPECIAVDGNRFKPYRKLPHQCIIKGDGKYQNIAAASILAKTYRDEYMLQLHEAFPRYGWKKNKGYPTKEHRLALKQHGACRHHRKSFQLLPKQLVLSL